MVLDNSYGKVRATYDAWTGSACLPRWADDAGEALETTRALVPGACRDSRPATGSPSTGPGRRHHVRWPPPIGRSRHRGQHATTFHGEATMSHILVVDDDASVLGLLGMALETSGHRVTALPDADGVMDAVKDGDVDGIVLDVVLPGESGLQLLARLRAHDATADVPVLMLTGRDDPATRQEGLEAGAAYFVTKPFDVDLLIATIDMMVAAARPAGAGSNNRDQVTREGGPAVS